MAASLSSPQYLTALGSSVNPRNVVFTLVIASLVEIFDWDLICVVVAHFVHHPVSLFLPLLACCSMLFHSFLGLFFRDFLTSSDTFVLLLICVF